MKPISTAILALLLFLVPAPTPVHADTVSVKAGDDLQAALDAARPGDTLLLQAGATFSGNFVLPVKTGSTYITVRSATADSQLPDASSRIRPVHAPLLAKIGSPNTMPALRTAPGAHHWRLLLLEFLPNRDGFSEIMQLGDGSSAQNQLAQVPYELELDRLYIHGDPIMGQKRGIALNARSVTIRNCYISDIKAAGIETQAIGGWNGPGPFLIENNYLEASGENFMLGGADPYIQNLVSENIVFRNNHLSRPLSWREPIVPTPGGLAATSQSSGTLPSGTYSYRVVARRRVGGGVVAHSTVSSPVSLTISGGSVVLSWNAVPHTLEYYVYGRSSAGATQFWKVTTPSFTDTGAAGAAGTPSSDPGTVWTVKNIFELKNARQVLVERNVFENNWMQAQVGYAIVLTPRNQDGGCPWCVVEDVTFRYNVVRNVAGGINILGWDDISPSQQTKRLRFVHNLFKIDNALGGTGWFVLAGNGPSDITIDHNTIDSNGTTLTYVYGGVISGVIPIPRFLFTNNAARHLQYGMNGAEHHYGNDVFAAYFSEGGEVRGNWLQGGTPSRYPAGNYFDGTFADAFRDLLAGDYSQAPGGPLQGRATDGSNIGADFAVLSQVTKQAIDGTAKGIPPAPLNLRLVSK